VPVTSVGAVAETVGFAVSTFAVAVTPVESVVPVASIDQRERVLTTDPGMGVIRHVDAGYERAIEVARERGVHIPMRPDLG